METGSLWSCHVSPTSSSKPGVKEEVSHSSPESDLMELQKFCIDDVKGPVCTTWKVIIPPFSTVNMQANSSVKGHCMQVHVLTEPMPGPQLPAAVVPTATYGELHPGSSRVPICLCNLSACTVEIPTKAVVGQVTPANQVPLVVHPTRTSEESKSQITKRMGLGGLGPPRSQRVARIKVETG